VEGLSQAAHRIGMPNLHAATLVPPMSIP
jgi:hypothetical protein